MPDLFVLTGARQLTSVTCHLSMGADQGGNSHDSATSGLILGFRPANERRRYLVTTSLIGWVQA